MRRLLPLLIFLCSLGQPALQRAVPPTAVVLQVAARPAAVALVAAAGLFPRAASASLQIFGGFEGGGAGGAESSLNGSPSWQTTTKRTGSYALEINPGTTVTQAVNLQAFTAAGAGSSSALSLATIYLSVYVRLHTVPSSGDEELLGCLTGALAYKGTVRVDSTRKLVFYDSVPTSLGTSTDAVSLDAWHRIDVKCGTSATVAAYEVDLDGVLEISGTNANTTATNAGGWFLGRHTDQFNGSIDYFFDDWAIDSAAFPGAQQTTVLTTRANGAAQTASIGAGSGSHFQIVQELPNDGNTSYLLTDGTTADAETEGMISTATAGITGTVNGVSEYCWVIRDAGTNGAIKVRLRSNTTNSDTSGTTSQSTYGARGTFSTTDPATSAAWTLGGVDGIEGGVVENQTGANKTRFSALYVFVNYAPAASGTTGSTGTLTGVGLLPPPLRPRHYAKLEWSLN